MDKTAEMRELLKEVLKVYAVPDDFISLVIGFAEGIKAANNMNKNNV